MRSRAVGTGALLLGLVLALGGTPSLYPAEAATAHSKQSAQSSRHANAATAKRTTNVKRTSSVRGRQLSRAGGISCVPFARNDSGIAVAGNAWQWWDNAAGVYARGSVPEAGSVLAFQSNGRMRLGHVAVVARVVNQREVEIDHANWRGPGMRGGVARNMPVVDVSANNDWSAVRVGLGQTGEFGSVYPTYGFIYDRPDTGTMVASAAAPAPQQNLNPPPRDLRPTGERGWQMYEEVAEAPVAPRRYRRGLDLSLHRSYPIIKVSTRQRR